MCVGLLLLAAAYIYGRPTLERWLNITLPEIHLGNGESHQDQAQHGEHRPLGGSSQQKNHEQTESERKDFELADAGNGTLVSPAGLKYGMGPNREHRIDHIMRHLTDSPERPTHGVFLGARDEVLALLDEAYNMILKNSNQVQSQASDQGSGKRVEYEIEMKRQIGYMAGENGKRRNYPKTTKLKLILEGDRPVTAYPTW